MHRARRISSGGDTVRSCVECMVVFLTPRRNSRTKAVNTVREPYLECDSPESVAWSRLGAAPLSAQWSIEDEPEAALHRIHAYSAKFPAFLARRAMTYAAEQGVSVAAIGDVFCGSGTVAYEARRAGLAFWGCDINPVAILIARAKNSPLRGSRVLAFAQQALAGAELAPAPNRDPEVDAFLLRWHSSSQIDRLGRLLASIEAVTSPHSPYRTALLCAFSSILRACSYWKARSTKPRMDPCKAPRSVSKAFRTACRRLAAAYDEAVWGSGPAPQLHLADVRTIPAPERRPNLLVCSGPYSTSVDYAAVHQLSGTWLGYFPQLKRMRHACIGTPLVGAKLRDRHISLNRVGLQAVFTLHRQDPAAASAIANYFVDMQHVARRCLEFLSPEGIAVFVIGNVRLRGQIIDNAAHLTEALLEAGFARVRVARRQVRNKGRRQFRDNLGRLRRPPSEARVYDEEFVLMAHRP
jgi:SAM-dependent methyltransferase